MAEDSTRRFQSAWWSIELPSNWNASEDDAGVSFCADPKIGLIQVSAARKPAGIVSLDDVYEFRDESNKNKIPLPSSLLNESGFFVEFEAESSIVRKWWLISGAILVLVTYVVGTETKNIESPAAQRIVSSLKINA